MRIAILGPYYVPQMFGIEKIMEAHARELVARGHEVCVITTKLKYPHGEYDLADEEILDGARVIRLPVVMRSLPKPFSYSSNGGVIVPKLGATLRSFRPDIIHMHNIGAAGWAYVAHRFAVSTGASFFYSTYHHPSRLKLDWIRKFFVRALNRSAVTGAAKIYHLTRSDFEKLVIDYPFAPAERFAVLPGGVSPALYTPEPRSSLREKTLLFVGRVDDVRKGFAVLQSALDELLRDPSFAYKLVVVGTLATETRQRLEAKYGSSIEVCGRVTEEELERHYSRAGIFVMPSHYEGFGMPYIEAMRYGLPVIGTNVGGIPEVVPPDTGILIPAGSPAALVEAIRTLVFDEARQDALGSAGCEWVKHFYWSQIVDQLASDYLAARAANAAG